MPSKKNKREAAAAKSAAKASEPQNDPVDVPAVLAAAASVLPVVAPTPVAPKKTVPPTSELSRISIADDSKKTDQRKIAEKYTPPSKLPLLTKTKPVRVICNSYEMNVNPTKLYRYDVQIKKVVGDKSFELVGSEGGNRNRQADCFEILVLAMKKLGHTETPFVYDGAAMLFSAGRLESNRNFVSINSTEVSEGIKRSQFRNDTGTLDVSIEPNSQQFQLTSTNILEENAFSVSRPVTQMMQIALSQDAKKNGFLITDGGSELYDKRNSSTRNGIETMDGVGAGIKIAEGRGKDTRAHLVLDYKLKQFFAAGPLKNLNLNWSKPAQLQSYLKGLRVATTYSNQQFPIYGVTSKPIGALPPIPELGTVLQTSANAAGKRINDYDARLPGILNQFYSKERQKKVSFTFPIENLKLAPNQKLAPRHGNPPTCKKINDRCIGLKRIGESARLLTPNSTLKSFGVTIDPNPISLEAVEVPSPAILYKNLQTKPDLGKKASWIVPKNCELAVPTVIKKILILFNSNEDPKSESAAHEFKSAMKPRILGVRIEKIEIEDLGYSYPNADVFEAIIQKMNVLKKDPLKPIVIYVDHSSGQTHNLLKVEERLCETITQHICYDKSMPKGFCGPMTLMNIMLKLNLKNGGLNHKVKMPNPEIARLWGDTSNTLLISYDVCHSSGKVYKKGEYCDEPSCVGFGYNGTQHPELIVGDFHYQLPRQEQVDREILSLRAQFILSNYIQSRGKIPDQIVILRDGVSEGQYPMVKQEEFSALCDGIKKKLGGKLPKMALFVVTKRHAHRLYVKKGGEFENVSPLTAVDHTIVRNIGNEVLFVSHCPIKGTAQPVLLNMLHNDGVFKNNDQLVQFITALCSSHQKSTMIVSLPETVYAADEYAKRGSEIFQEYKLKCARDCISLPKREIDDFEQPDYLEITKKLCYDASPFFKTKKIV